MALPDSEQTDKRPSESHKGTDKKEKPLSKVIVRRLPPNMDQETFLIQISPVPPYDYFYMVKGDASWGENAFSRAYINFSNPNDIFDFKEKFDNYVFLDNTGHEYPAVVEFAAFQKIPKKRNKVRVDSRVGTIESDPYYLEFVEMLNKPLELDEKPEYTYQITTDNKNDTMTPLLEYVKHKRAEKMRIREERREERKRKEFERKKFRDDERKKRFEDKPPKTYQSTKVPSPKEKTTDVDTDKAELEQVKSTEEKASEKEPEKFEKSSTSYYKNREKKYDDRKKDVRSKYPPKREYVDKREFKSRRDDYKDRGDYRSKYEEYKKEDPKTFQKKVKKYSEKREERKMEAQKAEQKKLEQQAKESQSVEKSEETTAEKPKEQKKDEENACKANEKSPKNVDESGKRIRNKDRPTIAIYRPGMLSKRKQNDGESESKDTKKD